MAMKVRLVGCNLTCCDTAWSCSGYKYSYKYSRETGTSVCRVQGGEIATSGCRVEGGEIASSVLPSEIDVCSLLQKFLPLKMPLTNVAGFLEQALKRVTCTGEVQTVPPSYNPVYRKSMNLY
jgi:hypothetical protein